MKALLIGFFMAHGELTFGYTLTQSEFQCQAAIQAIEDGYSIHLTDDNGIVSPPLMFGLCVDPERRVK